MPLITLCGYPCVGKTKFANILAEHIVQNINSANCIIVNEESLHLSKPEHYKSASQEKILRQNLKSAVELSLKADTFVILDSCNYIKGYRYELYCIARSQRTPHCVVHITAENEVADKWNESNCEDMRYDSEILGDLRRRFEAPSESNRWDKPLFHVNMSVLETSCAKTNQENSGKHESSCNSGNITSQATLHNQVRVNTADQKADEITTTTTVFSSWKSNKSKSRQVDDSSLSSQSINTTTFPVKKFTSKSNVYFSGSRAVGAVEASGDCPETVVQSICSYFRTAEAPQPNAATNTVKHSCANLLYEIDKVSQGITQQIVKHQQAQGQSAPLVFKEYDSYSLLLSRQMSMAELQRHRRQYLKVNSQHPPDSAEDVGKNFLEFLTNQC